jgi:hypothetical protein
MERRVRAGIAKMKALLDGLGAALSPTLTAFFEELNQI